MLNKKENNYIGATVKNIIVAFIYVLIIVVLIFLCFSKTINKLSSIIDMISVDTNKKVLKEVKLDLTTKNLTSYPEYATRYATLKIKDLDIDLPVYFGDMLKILKNGIGHSSYSYFPGEGGTIIYMGHNNKGYLYNLSKINIGSIIEVETTYGNYKYQVYDTKIVDGTDVDAINLQREEEILVLYTCYPVNTIGHAKQRFITYSRLVK